MMPKEKQLENMRTRERTKSTNRAPAQFACMSGARLIRSRNPRTEMRTAQARLPGLPGIVRARSAAALSADWILAHLRDPATLLVVKARQGRPLATAHCVRQFRQGNHPTRCTSSASAKPMRLITCGFANIVSSSPHAMSLYPRFVWAGDALGCKRYTRISIERGKGAQP